RELRLDRDVLAGVEVMRPDQIGEVLDDVRLGGDRIGADHLRPAECDRFGDGARALLLLKHAPAPPAPPARARTPSGRRRRSAPRPGRGTSGESPPPPSRSISSL